MQRQNKYTDVYPYWYYDEVQLSEPGGGDLLGPQYVTHQIKFGYDYLVQGFLISWPLTLQQGQYNYSAAPQLEFIQYERNRTILIQPTDCDILSTPGQGFNPGGVAFDAQQTRLGRAFMHFNYLISNRDALYLKVRGQQAGSFVEQLPSCRIVTVGTNYRAAT